MVSSPASRLHFVKPGVVVEATQRYKYVYITVCTRAERRDAELLTVTPYFTSTCPIETSIGNHEKVSQYKISERDSKTSKLVSLPKLPNAKS